MSGRRGGQMNGLNRDCTRQPRVITNNIRECLGELDDYFPHSPKYPRKIFVIVLQ